jgi:hypothetical protein
VEFAAHLVVGFVAGSHSERCVDALRAGHTLLADLLTKSGSFPEPPVQLTLDWMRSLCAVAAGLQKYNNEKYTTANADAFQLVRAYLASPAMQQPRGSQHFVTACVRVSCRVRVVFRKNPGGVTFLRGCGSRQSDGGMDVTWRGLTAGGRVTDPLLDLWAGADVQPGALPA